MTYRPHFQLDHSAYNSTLRRIGELYQTERKGDHTDGTFLREDGWLIDSAVSERLSKRKGQWDIHLTFIHVRRPLTLVSRFITSRSDRKKALLTGSLMRRQAAKDQRGTIKVEDDLRRWPPN